MVWMSLKLIWLCVNDKNVTFLLDEASWNKKTRHLKSKKRNILIEFELWIWISKWTCLNAIREHKALPYPRTVVGCCTFVIPIMNICCIFFESKYQLHWQNSSLNKVNCMVTCSPSSQKMKIVIKVQNTVTQDVIKSSGFVTLCENNWKTSISTIINPNFHHKSLPAIPKESYIWLK